MKDPKNQRSRWEKYFISNVSFTDVDRNDYLKKLGRIFYSWEAQKNISHLLDVFNPSIAHLYHIYHHISPSIIIELKKRRIPIVQRLSDFHLIAPNYRLFHNGAICEITKPTRFYKAIFHKCVKDSYLASLTEVMEKYIHFLLGWERENIDKYIVPSKFMARKLIDYKIPPRKIRYLHNFINSEAYQPRFGGGDYLLYFGRLSPEKGLDVLLKAMKLLPKINLKIVGDGPEYNNLMHFASKLDLGNVEFHNFLSDRQLKNVIAGCRATILPSVWFEISPNSILESYASGKPVIASKIGGIPELVHHGFTGLLFAPGSVDDCVNKITMLWKHNRFITMLGKQARTYTEQHFTPQKYYEKLMEIYTSAIREYR